MLSNNVSVRIINKMSDSPKKLNLSCPAGIKHCPLQEYTQKLTERCRLLEELVDHDPLTGLFNYRFLINALAREMERSRRSGEPLGLIMIDIDHFKNINDDFGHETGNCVLRELASILTQQTRQSDLVCRYGGDEIAIILPGINLFRAISTAERLRVLISKHPFDVCHSQLSVTVSAGLDIFTRTDNDSPEQFINRADRFLQKAKKEGKNRIKAPEPEQEPADTELTAEEKAALRENDLT